MGIKNRPNQSIIRRRVVGFCAWGNKSWPLLVKVRFITENRYLCSRLEGARANAGGAK